MITDIFEGKAINIRKNTEDEEERWYIQMPFVTITIPDFILDDFAKDLVALGEKMKELGY